MKDIVDFDSVKRLSENNLNTISGFRAKYRFQGEVEHQYLFDALLIFYDHELFDKLNINLSELSRLKNAYFWYSRYINALKNQGIATDDHEQAKFKIIEEIDSLGENADWLFIKEIDDLNH